MGDRNNRKVQYLAGICASVAFMFTGATLSWSSPAIPKFKSGEANVQITDEQSSWVVALHGPGALLGCYFGQVLNELVGRRRTILGSAVPGLLGAVLMMFTVSPEVMDVARLLMGISSGITAVVTMIYLTEIADKEIRGALGMVVQVMNNLGSLIVYGVGPFVSYMALNSILVVVPICVVVLCLWIPESPYYHLKDGRVEAARKEFMKLRGTKDEKWVDEQMEIISAHVIESMENKTTLKELLTNIRYRKAVYIVTGLKIVQYMTGIYVIQTYLEVIFHESSSVSGPNVSIIYGFVQLGAGICATFLTRWFGRRILMLISCLGVSIAMTILGIYFYLQDAVQVSAETLASLSALPLVGVLGFNILYAIGIGNLPYVMQAELFPVNVKAVASSSITMLACVLCFVLTKCYQGVKDSFGHYTVFWFFALIGYAGVVFIYYIVPETKDRTLEEVQNNLEAKLSDSSKKEADRNGKSIDESGQECSNGPSRVVLEFSRL